MRGAKYANGLKMFLLSLPRNVRHANMQSLLLRAGGVVVPSRTRMSHEVSFDNIPVLNSLDLRFMKDSLSLSQPSGKKKSE